MIVVYDGDQEQIGIPIGQSHVAFKKGVPSWFPKSLSTDINKKSKLSDYGLSIYGKDSKISAEAEKNYILLPTKLHLFIASLVMLREIQRNFPTCHFDIQCPERYKPLIQNVFRGNMDFIEYRDPRIKYYRQFILTPESDSTIFTPVNLKVVNWIQLMGMAGKVFDPLETECLSSPLKDSAEFVGDKVLLVSKSNDHELLKSLKNQIDNTDVHIVDDTDFDKSVIELSDKLTGYSQVIHIQDTPLAYLTSVLGLKTIVFCESKYLTDNSRQYEKFPNVIFSYLGDLPDFDEKAGNIVKKLGSSRVKRESKRSGGDVPSADSVESKMNELKENRDTEFRKEFRSDWSKSEKKKSKKNNK